MTTSPAVPEVSVSLTEEEVVHAGGPGTVNWLVRLNDGWVRAPSYPGAEVERLDRGSGIVWRTRVTLRLAVGTLLTRVETRPDPRPRSALDHLTSGAKGVRRRTLRAPYRVGPRGEPLAEPDPNRPGRR